MIFSFTSTVCAKANSSLHFHSARYYSTGRLSEHHLGLDDAHARTANPLHDGADSDELPPPVHELDPVPLFARELAHQHGLAVADPVLLLRVGHDLSEGEGDLV